MENLLSLAFDSLSSYDGPKVRKGLRQVEGLLAQICLSAPSRSSKSPATDDEAARSSGKSLSDLSDDLAFREFFKLQEGFEWNVALRLINTLDRLMGKGADGQNDLLILSSLDLIQGVLLLHPPSKALFSREQNMNLLLDLLEPVNCPAIQSATLLVLVVALIDTPLNTRTFEALDGLLTVTSLFKSRSTAREVKLKLVEFLYFYLMPEVPSIPRADARASVPAIHQRSPSKLAGAFAGGNSTASDAQHYARSRAGSESADTLTTEEKQELLGRHLSSVEDLVKDLRTVSQFLKPSHRRRGSGLGAGPGDLSIGDLSIILTLLALGVISGGDGIPGDVGLGISLPYNSNRPSVVGGEDGANACCDTDVTAAGAPLFTRESISTGATTSLGECACSGTPRCRPGDDATVAAPSADTTVSVSVYGPATASGPK
ncbi:Cell division control protein 14 [Colletotrichum sp. SAR 10_98]|nr:Cell division control protein 14 [Colletotrichum sp. SAR 10_98]